MTSEMITNQALALGLNPGIAAPAAGTPGRAVEVAAGLVFRHGRLLLTQRRQEDHLGGLWEFPGGKREPGETFGECLVRELREELAIDVEVGALVEEVLHSYPEKAVRIQFLACRWVSGEPKPIGCQALAWVERGELSRYAFPDADARLLKRLRDSELLWEE